MKPRADSLQHSSPDKNNKFFIREKGLIVSDNPGESDLDQHGYGLLYILSGIYPERLNFGKPEVLYQSLKTFRLRAVEHVRHSHGESEVEVGRVKIFNRLLVNSIFDVDVLLENTRTHTRMRVTVHVKLGHENQERGGSITD